MLHHIRHRLASLYSGLQPDRNCAIKMEPGLPAPTVIEHRRPAPEQVLSIPMLEDSADDIRRNEIQGRGQFLARQERWTELADAIRQADANRDKTPGGMPVADLLCFGARADIVRAAEHAMTDQTPPPKAPLLDGINALESMRRDLPADWVIDLIVAMTHIDLAWAWRGTGWTVSVPKRNRRNCAAHFDRAASLLDPHCGIERNSPLLAGARCALLAGQSDAAHRIADDYEDLIDLDPLNHIHMRAMGTHLLPRWFGTYEQLELEARRTAARTRDIWGNGAYTWVCLDAIAIDENACARVDVDFFIDGLRDIIATRPDQNTINLLAAYCSVTLRLGQGLNQDSDLPRLQITDCARWLIRDHMTEVHPMIWAHATEGFDNNARVTSVSRFLAHGRINALHAIADQFRDDIDQGMRVTFTPDGPRLHSA